MLCSDARTKRAFDFLPFKLIIDEMERSKSPALCREEIIDLYQGDRTGFFPTHFDEALNLLDAASLVPQESPAILSLRFSLFFSGETT